MPVPCHSDEGERVLAVELLVMERQLIGFMIDDREKQFFFTHPE